MSFVSEGVRAPSALFRPLAAQPGDGVASRKLHCLGLLFQPRTVVPLYHRLLKGFCANKLLRARALRRNIEMTKHAPEVLLYRPILQSFNEALRWGVADYGGRPPCLWVCLVAAGDPANHDKRMITRVLERHPGQ